MLRKLNKLNDIINWKLKTKISILKTLLKILLELSPEKLNFKSRILYVIYWWPNYSFVFVFEYFSILIISSFTVVSNNMLFLQKCLKRIVQYQLFH